MRSNRGGHPLTWTRRVLEECSHEVLVANWASCRGQRHATDVSVVCGTARGDRARGALPGTHLRGGVPGLQGEGAPLGVTGATAENLFRAKVAQ